MAKLKDKIVKELVDQSYEEYKHCLDYRRRREDAWAGIDDLYYGRKRKSLVSRANVHIPKLHGSVETFVSKIDETPFLEYEALTVADLPKEKRMNALIQRQRSADDWELVDTLSKKEGALYGRTVMKKYANSQNGFTDFYDVVDVLDALIDPMAGGLKPYEKARFCGQDNIIRTKYDLKDKDVYDQEAVNEIAERIESDTDADNRYQSHQTRRHSLGLHEAVYVSDDAMRLVEWYTTYKGEWYYVLFSPEHKRAVRTEKMIDVFGHTELPFVSWSPFPRPHEFWTPGLGDLLAEPNRVQNIILSQILDNNTYRNYGMMAYDTSMVNNPDTLVPRPNGKIPINGNPRDAVNQLSFPEISNALQAYQLVDGIFQTEVGITAQAKGAPHSKRMSASEFVGLLDEMADRFFTANKTYSHAMRRIAKLYHLGVQHHMTRTTRVKILGASEGYEEHRVKGSDVRFDEEPNIIVRSGAQDEAQKKLQRDRFLEFYKGVIQAEDLNRKFLVEKLAEVEGLTQDEIRRLMSPELEGSWESVAEAEQENEELLNKKVDPNRAATVAHIQKHLDFVSKTEGLDDETRDRILSHAREEIKFADQNERRDATQLAQRRRREAITSQPPQPQPQPPTPTTSAPIQPPQGGTPQEQVRLNAIRNAPPNR